MNDAPDPSLTFPQPGAAGVEISRLLDIMAALRMPETGCPWDHQQDFGTIAPYTIEEAYEVADAIERNDMAALPDELGDLLFQVVYYARLAEERGMFNFAGVARLISDKMIRRHPDVFGAEEARGAADVRNGWEAQKRRERADAAVLAGVPTNLPALTAAAKLTARAARVGFDWPDAPAVLDKLAEETAELRRELPGADPARLEDELGDMLFVLANLARKLDLDPERALRRASAKFTRRFNDVEQRLAREGASPAEAGLARMEELWTEAKSAEQRVP